MTVKKLTNRFLVVFGLCLLMAASASADLLYVNQLPLNKYNGNFVGPAGASFAHGRLPGDPGWDFDIICNDYIPTTWVPSSFQVRVTNLADAGSPRTKFSPLATYQQAAWLIDQMYLNPAEVGPIQYTIWELFTPGASTAALRGGWDIKLSNATIGTNYGFGRFEIYTPTSLDNFRNLPQEFMRRTSVPEPAMLGTLLFGFLGTGLFWRRRQRPL
jgi:hypothetical protein